MIQDLHLHQILFILPLKVSHTYSINGVVGKVSCNVTISAILLDSKHKVLRCCYFNVQSVVDKLCKLHNILYSDKHDYIFISESWLQDIISNSLLSPRTEYNIDHKDSDGKRCGGVCAFIKKNIHVLPVDLTVKYANFDIIGVDFVRQ